MIGDKNEVYLHHCIDLFCNYTGKIHKTTKNEIGRQN